MKPFIIFNLLITFGIMKMKTLLLLAIATNSICMESCSKDAESTSPQSELLDEQKIDNDKEGEKKQESTAKDPQPINETHQEPNGEDNKEEQKSSQRQPLISVEDIQILPKTHPLNQPVTNRAVDENSEAILNHIGKDVSLFADFGSGLWKGEPIGIPFVTVGKDEPKVPITFRANHMDGNYGHESDKGPMPIPLDAPVEAKFTNDGHVISVDVENGMLYELYNAEQVGDGWLASSAAAFDLNSNDFRTDGWTSADAAGLPIFPLLARYGEIEKGEIDHPIRFSLNRSKVYEGYVHPARHLIPGEKGNHLIPFGAILRLKADFDISSFSTTNQIMLKAMKKYGLIFVDVGENMFLKGSPNENWDNRELKELIEVKVANFDVVEMGEIKIRD